MNSYEISNRTWCHFCKRFVLSALIRVHRSSDQHRENYESSQPPPDIFATTDSSSFVPSDVIELASTSDGASASGSNKLPSPGTILISSSRGRLGPKYASDVTRRHLSNSFDSRTSRSFQHTVPETIHDTTTTTTRLSSNPSSLPSLDGSSDSDNATEHSSSRSSTLPPLSVILGKRKRSKLNKTVRIAPSSHESIDSFNSLPVPEGWERPEVLFSSISGYDGSQKSKRTFGSQSQPKSVNEFWKPQTSNATASFASTIRDGLSESHSSNDQETSILVISDSESQISDLEENFGETRDFSSKNWNDSTVILSDSDSQSYDSDESFRSTEQY